MVVVGPLWASIIRDDDEGRRAIAFPGLPVMRGDGVASELRITVQIVWTEKNPAKNQVCILLSCSIHFYRIVRLSALSNGLVCRGLRIPWRDAHRNKNLLITSQPP
jgi:hypothetical protein